VRTLPAGTPIAMLVGGGRPKDDRLKWTNTGLTNIKGAITGTCRSCDPQHTERYLAAYEWRFNRRFDRCLLCASDRGDRSIELGRGSGGDAGRAFDVSVEVASYQQFAADRRRYRGNQKGLCGP
jgi:hypothetical protein